ncbi:T9SS type B sorting domain-containing protein [Winogradskyella litoriviva]|uniref:T9SS type B sorting domain-containing protein n=1 Tax=Winogradskyella litoriviva TaxID=1220182 RepID=A0ABX2E844_9FLAO|nr:T9SS type B sorting domain-containing protein [Winogradskyella litoriviva]NRD23876.1 T9SS type B sorting domain-containing protein [Winogradskyella litoriviva]
MTKNPKSLFKPLLAFTTIFIFNLLVFAQEPNDCANAVTVCGNSSFSLDVNGVGTQELNGSNTCSGRENNSIWLVVNIATDGTLAFTLTPSSTSINEDYDFYVFGPNVACGNIGQAIRCSTTNPSNANQGNNLTGMNSTDPDPDEGPGADGDSFVSDIDVLAGESYFIVIDRPIGNSPFSIEWTGTATFPEGPSNPLLADSTSTNLPSIDACDDKAPFNDSIREFDFTQLSQDIINGESDVVVSYHLSESDANINANALSDIFNNTSSTQSIYVRVENTTTDCFIINKLIINVTTLTNFNVPTDYSICDNDIDGDDQNGLATFDFDIKSQEIIEGIADANYNISYYLSQADAEVSSSPLPVNYTNTSPTPTEIFVRIEDLDLGCIGFTSFNIEVLPKPIANDVSLLQCDEDGIPEGFTIFNITEAHNDITNSAQDASIEYYLSQIDAENQENVIDGSSFENFFNPQIVYARVTNTTSGCVSYSQVSLEVSTTASNNASIELCDTDGTEDGFMEFDLTNINNVVLAGTPTGLDLTYYETYNDALIENNPLNSTFTNTVAYNQTIYARVENANACYGISEIALTVFKLPNIELTDEAIYCKNLAPETTTLTGGVLDDIPNNYSYLWSTGETTMEIEVSVAGTYSVRVTNSNGCFKDRTINVLPSSIATIDNIEVSDASQNNTIAVSVTVDSEGDYEYALDVIEGPYQDSSIFYNVSAGLHTVYVRDKNNCGIEDQLVSVIGFPKFFTPNNDTFNDFWRISGISAEFQSSSIIYIFDRYGKLLAELDPLSPGWDGTFNGEALPTSDYWFKVKLEDGRTLRGHFTLKR